MYAHMGSRHQAFAAVLLIKSVSAVATPDAFEQSNAEQILTTSSMHAVLQRTTGLKPGLIEPVQHQGCMAWRIASPLLQSVLLLASQRVHRLQRYAR